MSHSKSLSWRWFQPDAPAGICLQGATTCTRNQSYGGFFTQLIPIHVDVLSFDNESENTIRLICEPSCVGISQLFAKALSVVDLVCARPRKRHYRPLHPLTRSESTSCWSPWTKGNLVVRLAAWPCQGSLSHGRFATGTRSPVIRPAGERTERQVPQQQLMHPTRKSSQMRD